MKLSQFVQQHRVRFQADLTDQNPNNGMPEGSNHWRCILSVGRKRMTVYFSQGPAICREPTVEDVLDCLASDASSYDNARSFEDWAAEYGYDTDSRKAEQTYHAVEKQSADLARLFSPDDLQALYSCDRL